MITHFVIHGEKPTQEALWKASFFLRLDDDDDDDDTDKTRVSLS